ncbi:MAG: hypothetical protein AAFR51_03920 [Pseudomonadota bacterium]
MKRFRYFGIALSIILVGCGQETVELDVEAEPVDHRQPTSYEEELAGYCLDDGIPDWATKTVVTKPEPTGDPEIDEQNNIRFKMGFPREQVTKPEYCQLIASRLVVKYGERVEAERERFSEMAEKGEQTFQEILTGYCVDDSIPDYATTIVVNVKDENCGEEEPIEGFKVPATVRCPRMTMTKVEYCAWLTDAVEQHVAEMAE